MRLGSVFLLAILLGAPLVPAPALGADADLRRSFDRVEQFRRSVEVDADTLEYSADQRQLTARGHVRLIFEDRALTADEVSVDLDDELATATGHVVLMDGESRLEGDRIEYNYRTNLGTITNGQGFLAPGLSFSGREIRREGEREFAVEDGRVTTCRACEPPPQIPDWEVRARQIHIFQDDYVLSRDSSIWVKGVPALYLPVAALPLGPRRTGFLIPRFGYGSRDGFSMRTPFFWAISRSQDVTITPIYRSRRGLEMDGEYRYVLDDVSRGGLFVRYVHDNLPGDPLVSEEVRWRHTQVLAPTWTLKGDVDYLSNTSLPRQFVETPVAQRTQATSPSSVFLTQMTDRYMFLNLLELTQDLSEGSTSQATRLPDIRFQWLPAPL
ncbi:MAG TPA: putative LPS assembly protein LptD, partial [Candidatus Sulfotelmatobacter sp.]|nr:putative LPS assembly protein LptD [Candidatus Sulfotelmatobacter sp.]